MEEFVEALFAYPAVVFTLALIVVLAFWLCVLAGALEHDAFDADPGTGVFGLGGVPATVGISLLVAFAWALSLANGVLLRRTELPDTGYAFAATAVLLASVAVAWPATRILVRPLRHLFPDEPGPSLLDFVGRTVTSLDPAEAPNATARREVEKINFALEAGNNVLLYLDDIQHTSPELLQKFIPLCDAQRRVAGVRDGRSHTFDLRGKRFAVVMSGNPYTEEGRLFRVPDMLANRADVWNLGEVLAGSTPAFERSFVENALTSNAVLAPLAERGGGDLDLLLDWAAHPDRPVRPDLLEHACPPAELDRILSVLRRLLDVRGTVLAVNAAYMASAARTDASRTEPPFRLQGSYRNMNRIAGRVAPTMDDAELAALVADHYAAESQTLAADTEANLLKLGELLGTLTAEEQARWAAVKAAYVATLGTPGGSP